MIEKSLVKSYCGGKPNYCTPEETPEVTGEVQCKTHPNAPHGFDRNASHSADRYVCECESWEPVDAVNMTPDRVDKTAKGEHEPVAWFIQYENSHEFVWSKPDGWRVKQALEIQPLYTAPPVSDYHEGWEEGFKAAKRDSSSWVGLREEEIYDYADKFLYQHGSNFGIKSFGKALEAKLKEKNT